MTVVNPPATPIVWQGNLSLADIGTGAQLNVTETSDPNGIASASGTTITVSKPGTYYVYAMGHDRAGSSSTGQQFRDDTQVTLSVLYDGAAQPSRAPATGTTGVNGNQGAGDVRAQVTAIVVAAAGHTISIFGARTPATGWSQPIQDGYVELVFIPTAANPR